VRERRRSGGLSGHAPPRPLGAPRPLRVPTLVAYPLAGRYGVMTMTAAQGASNALAKRALQWQLAYPSWRDGFKRALT